MIIIQRKKKKLNHSELKDEPHAVCSQSLLKLR